MNSGLLHKCWDYWQQREEELVKRTTREFVHRTIIILKIETMISPLFLHWLRRMKRKLKITTTITKVTTTMKPIVLMRETTEILCEKNHSLNSIQILYLLILCPAPHVRSYPGKVPSRTVDFHDPLPAYCSFHHIFQGALSQFRTQISTPWPYVALHGDNFVQFP